MSHNTQINVVGLIGVFLLLGACATTDSSGNPSAQQSLASDEATAETGKENEKSEEQKKQRVCRTENHRLGTRIGSGRRYCYDRKDVERAQRDAREGQRSGRAGVLPSPPVDTVGDF